MLQNKAGRGAKALALALVTLVVTATMAVGTAFAAEIGSTTVTINGLKAGDVVSAYPVATATVDANNNLTWTMASGLPEAYDTIAELSAITSDGYVFSGETTDSAAKDAADAIAKAIAGAQGNPSATAEGTSAALTLVPGYYLVRVYSTSDVNTVYQNMLVNVQPQPGTGEQAGEYVKTPDFAIDVKSTPVTIEKGVGANYEATTDDYSAGDSVPFRVTTNVPNYPDDAVYATFVITDTPSAGLEVQPDTIKVTVAGTELAAGENTYTLSATKDGYTITFAQAFTTNVANRGAKVVVDYFATLTEDAFYKSETDVTGNTAEVTFNPNPNTNATSKPKDETTVPTYGFVFQKVNAKGEPLVGAEFTLKYKVKDAAGEETEVVKKCVSDANGYVYFEDLGEGTYTVEETVVPAGYQKVENQTFVLNATNCTEDNPATQGVTEINFLVRDPIKLVDADQPVLPVTGGPGTLAVTAFGVAMMAGAVVLVSRARKQDEK